jgi:hypothetical protein
MKFLLAILALTVGLAVAWTEDEIQSSWIAYKHTHNKKYDTHAEELLRFGIFKAHLEIVTKHNADADKGLYSFWLTMNKFADLHNQEFVAIYNGYNQTLKETTHVKPNGIFYYKPNLKVPDSIVSNLLYYLFKFFGYCIVINLI